VMQLSDLKVSRPAGVPACLILLLVAAACSSKSGSSPDGAGDAGDGGTGSGSCGASLGADHLSFDVTCTTGCTATRHVTFNVGAGDRETAPCVDADGHLQLFQLVGSDQSVFELDIDPGYNGKGNYGLGTAGLLAYQNVSADCTGVGQVPLLLGLPDPNDPHGSCSIDVTSDCTTTRQQHALAGTFRCSLPVTDRGANCTLTNGVFSFRSCE